MAEVLRQIISRNRAGHAAAIPSVCSAHPDVLRASLLLAAELGRPIVIEATSNQVNQDGGYTGQRPADFIASVRALAHECGLGPDQVVFGGDHLGPQVWRKGPAEAAMAKARVLVADYVRAGFTKIHLDCSEGCAGEAAQVGDALAASRAAELAAACEDAAEGAGPLYVIGTEVPPPGGARHDIAEGAAPTTPAHASATIAAHRAAFAAARLDGAWDRVVGLVAQPGVEFGPMQVQHLDMGRDPGLRAAVETVPGLCLEAHSTDYQHAVAYPRLARLGFAFQKVGPALTFAWREAIYALDHLRAIAGRAPAEGLPEVMERLMLAAPGAWQGHYHGDAAALRLQRHFGYADRIRYYWPHPEAARAVAALLHDVSAMSLPAPVLSQGFDAATMDRAEGLMGATGGNRPRALLLAAVQQALAPYYFPQEGTA
ncbi:MAG: tagatose-6-phosphate kinase [Limimaricola sp.]|uniref:class II D-tagatose-bisphosphate aldolase non-catalytic subunit n=1 Tax=Limimaricola sp. TaxID=2211665 RepID=UPI001DD64BCE|nr:class II D-tagatose-bisphosphate aldolase, non-catalytic subunit [Limimaricola sp.]MBI1416583.1 tagatose-6-phosphate kinase [Limimaricola sp.]